MGRGNVQCSAMISAEHFFKVRLCLVLCDFGAYIGNGADFFLCNSNSFNKCANNPERNGKNKEGI